MTTPRISRKTTVTTKKVVAESSNDTIKTLGWTVKYRPTKFNEVVGNEKVTKELLKSITNLELPTAILFHGHTGVGKTTLARVLARTLNCKSLNACGVCDSCLTPLEFHRDYTEVNSADKRKIDDMRQLLAFARYSPLYNIRIICMDECHKITGDATNAWLKELEEPSKTTLWVLSTTEPEALIPTVLSRTTMFGLEVPSEEKQIEFSKNILQKENITMEADVVLELVKGIVNINQNGMRGLVTNLESAARQYNESRKDFSPSTFLEELSKNVSQSGTGSLKVASASVRLMLAVLSGKPTLVCRNLGEIDESEYVLLCTNLIYIVQYGIDAITSTKGKKVFHWSEANKSFFTESKKLGGNLTIYLQLLNVVLGLREKLVTTNAMYHRSVMVDILGNEAIRFAKRHKTS